MLRFAEHLLLVLLDDRTGALMPAPRRAVNLALAGAVLMDLQLESRIDTDLDNLTLVDPTPLDDDLLDPVLADIAAAEGSRDSVFWVARTASSGEEIRDKAIARLVERNILVESRDDDVLSLTPEVAQARRYPLGDGKFEEDVRLRIMRVLFSDEIPEPADIVIIGLVDACGAFPALLTPVELKKAQERISLLGRMDLIGQAVAKLVNVVEPDMDAAARTWPAARRWPIVGNGFAMRRDVCGFMTSQYRKLGPVFRVRAFTSPLTVLAGQEANLFLLRKQRDHLKMGDVWDAFRRDLGATRFPLFGMDGPDHVRMRREMTGGFLRTAITDRLPDVVEMVRRHVAEWPLDRPLPGFHVIQRVVNEQVCGLLAGTAPREYLDDVIFYFSRLMLLRVILPVPLPLRTPRFRRARRRVLELCLKVLRDRQLGRRNGPRDAIDDLLSLHRNDPAFMPESDLTLATLMPFIVGLDTSASITASMLYVVLKRPDLRERARAEADALFAGGEPTAERLRGMDVTHRIAMEVMRMYPVTPAVRRTVTSSFDFGGYRVPAGEELLFGMAVTHFLPEHFPDPHRFDIDRYLPGRDEHREPGVYVPFGLGVHRCLGSGFAEVQIALTVATLLHETELELDPPDYELKLVPSPFPTPSKGFRFRMLRRHHRS